MESFDFMIPKQKLIVCRSARKMPAVVELQSIHEKSSQGTVLTFSFLQRFTIRGSKVLFRHLLVPTSHTPVLRHSTDWRSKRYHSFNKDLTLGYLRAMTGCERLVAQRFQRKTLSSPVVFDTRWRWLFPLNLQSPEQHKEGKPEDLLMKVTWQELFLADHCLSSEGFERFFNHWPIGLSVSEPSRGQRKIGSFMLRILCFEMSMQSPWASLNSHISDFMHLLTKGCGSGLGANRAMYRCSSLQNDFCLLWSSPAVLQTDRSSTTAIRRSVAFF